MLSLDYMKRTFHGFTPDTTGETPELIWWSVFAGEQQKDYDGNQLKKEVIGGYILFPGDGEPLKVAKAKFQQSLNEVNIGAFPLRPKDVDNRRLLEHFIEELIGNSASGLLHDSIPQKGLHYSEGEPVYLMISASNQYNAGYISEMKAGLPCMFCCDYNGISEDLDLRKVQYLVPVFSGKCYGYYEVNSVNTKVFEGSGNPLRIEFNLNGYKEFGFVVKSDIATSKGFSFTYQELMKYCNHNRI